VKEELPMIATLLAVAVVGLMIAGSGVLYLLPVLIGMARRVPDIGSLATVNILLGWTFIGWAGALAMALRSAAPAAPAVQVVQNFPPACPPAQLSGAGWAGPSGPPPLRPGVPPPLVLPPRPAGPASVGPAGHR
jgi:Superinfection immunity protein